MCEDHDAIDGWRMNHLSWSIPHAAQLAKNINGGDRYTEIRALQGLEVQSSPYGAWPCQPHDQMR